MRYPDTPPDDWNDVGSETIARLTAMYEEHGRSASPIQHAAIRTMAFLARSATLTMIVVLVAVYMVSNLLDCALGSAAFEAFPFLLQVIDL